jgi:apolipoprotein N-acyltransferase
MNATAPTPSVPPSGTKAVKLSYRSLDFAYACFAFIAFALCFGPLLWILPLSQGDREGYAMLLGVPIMFGAFIAGIVGLVLAIVYRSEW